MSRARLPLVPHLTLEEIYRRYRACRAGVEKTHWHLIWLMARPQQPLAPAHAAAALGLSAVWARALLKRWNAQGRDGLADRAQAPGDHARVDTGLQICHQYRDRLPDQPAPVHTDSADMQA